MQAFARLDTRSGDVQVWTPGPRCFCEELLFVPGPEGETREDDGHLLGMVYDNELQLSSLVVRALDLYVPQNVTRLVSKSQIRKRPNS